MERASNMIQHYLELNILSSRYCPPNLISFSLKEKSAADRVSFHSCVIPNKIIRISSRHFVKQKPSIAQLVERWTVE